MKIILGLGNPGSEYAWTRHNMGYMAVDLLAKTWGTKWTESAKFVAAIAESPENGVVLVKSLGYYNEVGRCASKIAGFYKTNLRQDFLAVCDDFNLEFGQIRLRPNGSAGGNNGLKSLISALGTDKFARLRIGTNSEMRQSPEAKISDSDFVLGKLAEGERKKLPEVLKKAVEKVQSWLDSPANGDI